ncbi:MAG: sugar phosphate isomerase/epimerase [Oscillospiraceae bacterium]|nr:sugar phosphate isomerase/epimerase [Oscillospiraceae bacterium]
MEQLRITPKNTYWGHALAWYADYTAGGDADPHIAKMDFLAKYGMKAYGSSPKEIDALEPAARDKVFQALSDRDMHIILHASINHVDGEYDEMDRFSENQIALLEKYVKPCRSDIVTCCAANHRYDRKWPWDERIKRFSRALSPIAAACYEMGAPFSIENHADYFVSDLLEIIRETPRLYIFLDTANALHIGEHPVRACEDAAPYVVGTHFKDHAMVKGEKPPLHYEIRGCALGDGDAELKRQYEIIFDRSPFRDKLVMLFELFAPEDKSLKPLDCFEKSVAFVRGLQDAYESRCMK